MTTPRTKAGLLTCLAGAAIGLVVLGGGGRAAMHAIARVTTGTGGFTLGGTVTVLLLGAVSGLVGGILLLLSRVLFHRRSPLPSVVYWTGLFLIALRGIKPVSPLNLAAFLPVVAVFGALLQAATWRWRSAVAAPLRS